MCLRCWNLSKGKDLLAVLSLESWCSDLCREGHISNCIPTVNFFFFQSVDGSGRFTISPEDTVSMVGWLVDFIYFFCLQLSSWLCSCKGICWIPSVVRLGCGWEAGFIYKSFCRITALCSRMSLFILCLITFHFPSETTIIILTINHAVT